MTKDDPQLTKIPFIRARFLDPDRSEAAVELRLERFLYQLRTKKGDTQEEEKKLWNGHNDPAEKRIARRAKRYARAVNASSGLTHLQPQQRKELDVLRDGVNVVGIASESIADEIAALLHAEFPWMSVATTLIWHALRRAACEEHKGVWLPPMLLVGPPGIGKTAWSHRLAELIGVPPLVYDATQNNASFGICGGQKGWSSGAPGQLLSHIMSHLVANPLVVVDEVEKAGTARSIAGRAFDLIASLLPFLEPSTAENWRCPYYEVGFDLSHVSWILLANDVSSLPQPLLSRCTLVRLGDLSADHILTFARKQCDARRLTKPSMEAVMISLMRLINDQRRIDLRDVIRILERAVDLESRPMLN